MSSIMPFNYKLRKLLNENAELNEKELYNQAIQQELEEEFNQLISDNQESEENQEMTPEEKLDNLSSKLEEFAKDEEIKNSIPLIMELIKNKVQNDIPVEQIISFLKSKFNLNPEIQGEIESVLKELSTVNTTPESPLIVQAQELAECITPQIAIAFKPAAGIESDEFTNRAREHVNKYIRRVNGENVEIDQALTEMKALFDLDEDLENKMRSTFKVAKGVLDEETLSSLKEAFGGTVSSPGYVETLPEPASNPEQPLAEESKEPDKNENTSDPSFYSEYRNVFEDLEHVSESIIENHALKEEVRDGFDYNHILETISRAATIAMRAGAENYNKEPTLEKINEILNEDIDMDDENINSSLSNSLRQAYDIGNNYSEDFLRNEELYKECRSVDMTISLNEIINMFENDVEEPVTEESLENEDYDGIMEESDEDRIINSFNEFYNKRIGKIFDN